MAGYKWNFSAEWEQLWLNALPDVTNDTDMTVVPEVSVLTSNSECNVKLLMSLTIYLFTQLTEITTQL